MEDHPTEPPFPPEAPASAAAAAPTPPGWERLRQRMELFMDNMLVRERQEQKLTHVLSALGFEPPAFAPQPHFPAYSSSCGELKCLRQWMELFMENMLALLTQREECLTRLLSTFGLEPLAFSQSPQLPAYSSSASEALASAVGTTSIPDIQRWECFIRRTELFMDNMDERMIQYKDCLTRLFSPPSLLALPPTTLLDLLRQ